MSISDHDPGFQDQLRPEIISFLEKMGIYGAPFPPCQDVSPADARRNAETIRENFVAGGPQMVRTEEYQVPHDGGSVRIRVYHPSHDARLPGLFYLHGGGWVLFGLDTHDRLMREYAARANVRVIGIEYSLAPEHKFPTQIHEVVASMLWCVENANLLGIDRDRLAVGGDSAGGNLSIASFLKLRERGQAGLLKALVLNYGAVGIRGRSRSVELYGGGEFLLSAAEMDWFWDCYLGDDSQRDHPLANPLGADLDGLPPVYMVIADHDILYDENIILRDHLWDVGVEVDARIYSGTVHGFLESVSLGGVADEALTETAAWLKTRL